MEFWLDGLKPGMQAVVTEFHCSQALQRRLEEFGMVEGTEVSCRYRSPGGDVAALGLRGTTLAVRRADLAQIAARQV